MLFATRFTLRIAHSYGKKKSLSNFLVIGSVPSLFCRSSRAGATNFSQSRRQQIAKAGIM